MRLPAGYVDYDRGSFRVIAMRWELDEMVGLLTGPERHLATEAGVGRGGTRRVVLPGGKAVYLRKFLRGGAVRYLLRDLYLLRPERPLVELVVTETARGAGCPVPHVLAAYVEEATIGYRGWLVTEAVDGARPLIDAFAEASESRRAELFEQAGRAIRRLHAAGVYHVDLGGHNILVGPDDRVTIVDFDRATLGVPNDGRRAAAGVRRFWRSMDKLTAAKSMDVDGEARRWLQAGYGS